MEDEKENIKSSFSFLTKPLFETEGVPQHWWPANAIPSKSRGAKGWHGYVMGYKKAGDALISRFSETSGDQDYLVFPAVFLYRHYLELRLKDLQQLSSEYLGKETTLKYKHGLVNLWDVVRPNLELIQPHDEDDIWFLDRIEERIREFDRVDSGSISFRYPVNRGGAPSLSGLDFLNLWHLGCVVNDMSRVLDGYSYMLTDYIASKNEMMAEYDHYEIESDDYH